MAAAWRSAGLPAMPIQVGRNGVTALSVVIYESGGMVLPCRGRGEASAQPGVPVHGPGEARAAA